MAARKPKPRPCRQRGVCPNWDTCPFHHDERECRVADTTADESIPMEVD